MRRHGETLEIQINQQHIHATLQETDDRSIRIDTAYSSYCSVGGIYEVDVIRDLDMGKRVECGV